MCNEHDDQKMKKIGEIGKRLTVSDAPVTVLVNPAVVSNRLPVGL